MATIPEIEARIHALWATGEGRTPAEAVELGQLLTSLEAEMPPGDFYTHVLEVLHMPARDAQHFMASPARLRGPGAARHPRRNGGHVPTRAVDFPIFSR